MLRALLLTAFTTLFLSCASKSARALEDSRGEDPGVVVDKARGELRIPCWFVNPSRLLEVFASHEDGPTTHETLVAVKATGAEIYRGLVDIGCRGTRFWNATSKDDFFENLGDRLLVLVRWSAGGVEQELPAESVIVDIYDGEVGFPSFVRGFSFSAPGDSPTGTNIPEHVEITLGASRREHSSYSLLGHATNLPRLRPWALGPQPDDDVLVGRAKLVENRVQATLVLRRFTSEVELFTYASEATSRRGLVERAPLYEKVLVVAGEIDELKARYLKAALELKALVPESSAAPDAGRARNIVRKLREGRWLCESIEERYLALFGLQEEYRLQWLESQSDLPFELRDEARVSAQQGVLVEAKLAAKERDLAALRREAGEELGKDDPREHGILQEIQGIELRRQVDLEKANLKYARWRLERSEDDFSRELAGEDVLRHEASILLLKAKASAVRTRIAEFRARAAGHWDERQARILAARGRASQEIELARLVLQRVELLRQIRWERYDAEEEGFPERSRKAEENLKRLHVELKHLDDRIAEAR